MDQDGARWRWWSIEAEQPYQGAGGEVVKQNNLFYARAVHNVLASSELSTTGGFQLQAPLQGRITRKIKHNKKESRSKGHCNEEYINTDNRNMHATPNDACSQHLKKDLLIARRFSS